MNKTCARCTKIVYPIEELKCLDKTWHKTCFKCHECGMTLNMKTYKGFNKLPYCEAHIPKAKATAIADTPELKRIAENTKIQSNVKYHADFEKQKGKVTQVADDPETLRIKQNTKIISNVAYHGDLEKKAAMEKQREAAEVAESRDNESEYFSEALAAEQFSQYQTQQQPQPQAQQQQNRQQLSPIPSQQHQPQQQSQQPQQPQQSQQIAQTQKQHNLNASVPQQQHQQQLNAQQHPQQQQIHHNHQQNPNSQHYLNTGHVQSQQSNYSQQQQQQQYYTNAQQQQQQQILQSPVKQQTQNHTSQNYHQQQQSAYGGHHHHQQQPPQQPAQNYHHHQQQAAPVGAPQNNYTHLRSSIVQHSHHPSGGLVPQETKYYDPYENYARPTVATTTGSSTSHNVYNNNNNNNNTNNNTSNNNSGGLTPGGYPTGTAQQNHSYQYQQHQHQQNQSGGYNQHQQQHYSNYGNNHHAGGMGANMGNGGCNGTVLSGVAVTAGNTGIGKIADYDPLTDGPRNIPTTTRQSATLIYSSDRGAVHNSSYPKRIGSVADIDPANGIYSSIAEQQNQYYQQQNQMRNSHHQQPNKAPKSNLRVYRALYDYEAQDTDEVSFSEGDLIFEVESIDSGWMTGKVERTGKTGMLPANYVEPAVI